MDISYIPTLLKFIGKPFKLNYTFNRIKSMDALWNDH